MTKLILMRGLPSSGKSTRAKEIIQSDGNTVRVNRDLLRTMLHFDKWSGFNEGITKDVVRMITRELLESGMNVIIDDTNLIEGTIESWNSLASECNARFFIEEIETPMEECLIRDRKREKRVGDHVIYQMALQNGLYPKPKKGFVLCDLDGTLANIKHRLHFVKKQEGEKKDWKGFFDNIKDDLPRNEVIDILMKYEEDGYDCFIVSARPDNYREATECWLEKTFKGYKPYKALLMRRAGDRRDDTETKSEMYEKFFKQNGDVHAIIDDRKKVIDMWRVKGLNVIDVGNGVEF